MRHCATDRNILGNQEDRQRAKTRMGVVISRHDRIAFCNDLRKVGLVLLFVMERIVAILEFRTNRIMTS